MAFLGLFHVLVAWLWVQYLPGYALSRLLFPEARGLARHGLALIGGFSLFPLMVFLGCVFFEHPMDAPVLWAAATVVNLAAAVLIVRRGNWRNLDVGLRDTLVLIAIGLGCTIVLVLGVRSLDMGDVFSTVGHCLFVMTMHVVSDDPSTSISLYDALSGGMMHFLVPHPTEAFNGLAHLFHEQRLGNAVIVGPGVALHGTLGWLTAPVQAASITAVFSLLTARQLGARPVAAAIAAALFTYGTMAVLTMYHLNENAFALALVAFLIWAAIQPTRTVGWVVFVGLTAGFLIGVRHTACLFWPAVVVACLGGGDSAKLKARRLVLLLGCAILAALPWLYVNELMLGSFFGHPKIHSDSADRVVRNVLFGLAFDFRPLNWPFAEQLVRTPWNPFPTFLWIPLWAGLCYGQAFIAMAVLGAWRLILGGSPERRRLALLALFALPHTLAIAGLEGVDWEQLTYIAPGLLPLAGLGALGIDWLWGRRGWVRRALVPLAFLAVIVGGSASVRLLHFPADTRLLENKSPAPGPDRGTENLRRGLTAVSLLPRAPTFQAGAGRRLLAGLSAIVDAPDVPTEDGLPVYPSGRVVLHSGYGFDGVVEYAFEISGRRLTERGEIRRTGWYASTVSLRLPARRARFEVKRRDGDFKIEGTPLEETTELHDFTIWLHTWRPAITSVAVRWADRPVEGIRTLRYGTFEDHGGWWITNHPEDSLTSLPYTVDPHGESIGCGGFLFLDASVDVSRLETLGPVGGHLEPWPGTRTGTLSIPLGMRANRILLFSEPFCSSHIPQFGDRYAVVEGPFEPGRELRFVLDRIWEL